MKAVTFQAHGPADNLSVVDWPVPEPEAGEVRVRIMAAAMNGFDPMILGATTSLKTPLPMVPCGDGAGVIDAIGDHVTEWSIGDRVSIMPYGDFGMMGETAIGTAREYVTLPADNLVAIPDGVGFAAAAALPVAYGTAYRMMVTRGKVAKDDIVLVLGAAGGVGTGCVQFARAAGARVIATASGQDKKRQLAELGCELVLDSSEDFVAVIREAYGRPRYDGPGGVTMVVNYIGGDTWARSLKVLSNDGRMVTCGASAGHDPKTDIRYIWSFEQTIIGSDGWSMEDQREILEMTATGVLKPIIHAVRPFSQAREAMLDMAERRVFGKLILVPDALMSDAA